MDKLYIIHYYYPGTDPWKNIMNLPEKEAFRIAVELAAMHPDTASQIAAGRKAKCQMRSGDQDY